MLSSLVVAQYLAIALSSAGNAWFFARYRTTRRRRRMGAIVLLGVSLTLALQSLYFGVYLHLQGAGDPRRMMAVGAPALVSSLVISGLILRHGRGHHG